MPTQSTLVAMPANTELPLLIRVGYVAGVALVAYAVTQKLISIVQKREPRAAVVPAEVLRSRVTIRPVPSREQKAFTAEMLARYNGETESSIYISLKNIVFQVGPQLYGAGAPYHVYAGKDISRALAKSSLEASSCNKDFETGVTPAEKETLEAWFTKFEGKYAKVGWFVPESCGDSYSAV